MKLERDDGKSLNDKIHDIVRTTIRTIVYDTKHPIFKGGVYGGSVCGNYISMHTASTIDYGYYINIFRDKGGTVIGIGMKSGHSNYERYANVIRVDGYKITVLKLKETEKMWLMNEILNKPLAYLANTIAFAIRQYHTSACVEINFENIKEETKMNQNELYDKYHEALMGIIARKTVASVINSVTAGTASTKKVNTTFEPSVREKGLNSLIKNVIINEPSIIVFWTDGSKTIMKCAESDTFDPEIGICIAFMKKFLGNTGNYHQILRRVIKNAKNVTGEADKKREARKAKKEAAKRKKEEEAEKRADEILNDTEAKVGFLNTEE